MALPIPQRTHPRTWATIAETIPNPFTIYLPFLARLDIEDEILAEYFGIMFESAISTYTDAAILRIFVSNYYANYAKYETLCKIAEEEINPINNIDITETFEETRTPDLTSTRSSTGSGSTTGTSSSTGETATNNETETTRNQILTSVSTTPSATKITTHEINPYDDTGLRTETKDTVSDATTTTTTDTYTGQPDMQSSNGSSETTLSTSNTATSTSTASGTVRETGTEDKEHTLTRRGRDWKILPNEVVAAAEEAAAAMNVLYIICQDLADLIFIQVWD